MEEGLPSEADHVAADRQGFVRPLTAAQRETEGSETCWRSELLPRKQALIHSHWR